ncbi:MAG: leucine--tRNA ligase [Thermoplasmatota archaeon]
MPDWDLEAIAAKWQKRWWDQGIQHADRPPSGPTYFLHFAYPGVSGFLHVGHMRGFTYADVLARHKRMTGHHVLFPAGFHASGIPAVAFAAEVARGEKDEYLLANGFDVARDGPIQRLADPRAVVEYFSRVYTFDYWKRFGLLIDERRNCTTIDDGYMRFIQWQFRALDRLGYLIEKPHYAPYCPVQGPVAVDKSETDIKQGGNAEIQEFLALRFQVEAGPGLPHDAILPCATLRPETLYGCTNVWVRPDHRYRLVRVWRDGAVKDTDPSEVWVVSEPGQRRLVWQFERAEPLGLEVAGTDLVGREATVPVTGKRVPVEAGAFVDPAIVTGVVMSVPAHAPFDWMAYEAAGLAKRLGPPPIIVTLPGSPKGIPAQQACLRHGVSGAGDHAALEAATQELYAQEFNDGVLTALCGAYAGKRVKAVKDVLRADFVQSGQARILRQFNEAVISRAGQLVEIRRVPDQPFIHYAQEAWTAKAKGHAAHMEIHPARYAQEMPNVLDWFGDRACVRRGAWLGTPYPFKPGWIIEPIADSTFYPWYYLVSRYLKSSWNPEPPGGGLRMEELVDPFFDYVFNGKGRPQRPLWEEVRKDVLAWGPVDLNLGGKEHQTVHFPVYIMNQVALLEDPKLWPRGLFVHWWVTQKAGVKISKSKGGAEPIPGAAQRYGVDAMRLYYCHVGSPHVDIEWDPDVVLDYRRHLQRVVRLVETLVETDGGEGPMDAWMESAFHRAIQEARAAYEAKDLRQAASVVLYGIPESLRWYLRRGGANRSRVPLLLQGWARLMCPLVPHLAEEIHELAGGHGLCSTAALPEPGPVDEMALAAEAQLRVVLDDLQTVRKLSGLERPSELTLFTTAAWKRELAGRAVAIAGRGGKFPVGEFLKDVMSDPALRRDAKAVQAFATKLPGQVMQLTAGQRALLAAGADERAILARAAPFLAAEMGVGAVYVYAADDPQAPDHPKRLVAAPLKPGIALA